MSDRERLHDAVREVRESYDQLNEQRLGRRWDLTDYALGFVGDVGDLAKLIMAHEGHRTDVAAGRELLAHELSDCLFSLLVIAEATGIDLEARFPADMAALTARIRARITADGPASPADADGGPLPPAAP
ncbi:nucleotide pyrophosphohydrolase [Kitasatospora sp. NBC_01246]|uniref:nucleotide pyrophosphohydrolase n=1 Tax=Kitasatospora sp. NBC_01246 TaxID=2903570 RepID=UPI002E3494D2|nr:nucleotide pyrophosphohydrolase [Kitasatospora sp. NBC_01246]